MVFTPYVAVSGAQVAGPKGDPGAPGLPGVNAIPADEAVAAYAATPTSETRKTLDSNYVPLTRGYDVILLAGQSNMVGVDGPPDPYLDPADGRIVQWGGSGPYLGQQVAGVDPLLHHGPYGIGPGMSFARWWVREKGRAVMLVPVGHVATGFTTTSINPAPSGYHFVAGGGSWDKAATDGGTNLYDYAVDQANAALASDPDNRLVAILWYQGEGDGATVGSPLNQATYSAKLDALINNFRADIAGATTAPVMVGRGTPDWYDAHSADEFLDLSHLDTPTRRTRTAWVRQAPAGSVISDGVHLTAAMQRLQGRTDWPEAYALAVANVTGVDPLPPTDLTATQSGTTLTVRWARPLGRATNYMVEKNTGSGWTTVTRTPSTNPVQVLTGLSLGSTVQMRVSTINEAGTSIPSDEVGFTLVNAPATPASLAGSPSAWSVAITHATSPTATSYLLEYKKAADSTWIPRPASASTSQLVPALEASTSYHFRISASNAGGTSAPSSTVTVSTTAPSYLADDVGTVAVWSYSVRKTRSSYAGACMRVRRSSDNTESDIGFDGAGLLDTAALATFVGANSGYVSKWYNQGSAGSAADLIMGTAGSQPRIRNAGTTEMKNARPAVFFDGTDDFMSHPAPALLAASGVSALIVASTRRANSTLFGETSPSGRPLWTPFYAGPGLQEYVIVVDDLGNTELAAATSTAIPDTDALVQESVTDSTSAVTLRRNGADTTINATSYVRTGGHTPSLFNVGVTTAPYWHQGWMSELAFYTSVLSGAAIAAGEANEKGYFAIS
jgi:hypothetical protein